MLFMLGFLIFFFARVQLGDHDHGPLLDGLKRPSDYVLAGKNLFFQLCSNNQLTVGLIAELVEPAPESLRSGFKSHSGLKIILEMGS